MPTGVVEHLRLQQRHANCLGALPCSVPSFRQTHIQSTAALRPGRWSTCRCCQNTRQLHVWTFPGKERIAAFTLSPPGRCNRNVIHMIHSAHPRSARTLAMPARPQVIHPTKQCVMHRPASRKTAPTARRIVGCQNGPPLGEKKQPGAWLAAPHRHHRDICSMAGGALTLRPVHSSMQLLAPATCPCYRPGASRPGVHLRNNITANLNEIHMSCEQPISCDNACTPQAPTETGCPRCRSGLSTTRSAHKFSFRQPEGRGPRKTRRAAHTARPQLNIYAPAIS